MYVSLWKVPTGLSHTLQSLWGGREMPANLRLLQGFSEPRRLWQLWHQMLVSVKGAQGVWNCPTERSGIWEPRRPGVGLVTLCCESHLELPRDGDQIGLLCFQDLRAVWPVFSQLALGFFFQLALGASLTSHLLLQSGSPDLSPPSALLKICILSKCWEYRC